MEYLLKKWNVYLDKLDRNHKGFEIFDYSSGKLNVKDLRMIMGGEDGGLAALDKKIDELRDINENVEYAMFKSTYRAFLNGEGIEYNLPENEEGFRTEFECHVNWNIEKLFDFQVLLIDGKKYSIDFDWWNAKIDESCPEQKMFKSEALKYISEEQFKEILVNSFDGSGFFGIVINAQNIIRAIRECGSTVSGKELVIGIHDEFNGSGYFQRVNIDKEYIINFGEAELDYGNFSLGGIFGNVDWEWK